MHGVAAHRWACRREALDGDARVVDEDVAVHFVDREDRQDRTRPVQGLMMCAHRLELSREPPIGRLEAARAPECPGVPDQSFESRPR